MTDGPYVVAAVLCERVLEEKDGVLTAVRIVDRTTIAAPEGAELVVALTALISLKPGKAVGRYTIGLRPEAPSGMQLPALAAPINFEGGEGDRGVNLVLPLQMQAEEGLYWFDVLWIDDRASTETVLTRMPLRVVWQPMPGL